MPFSSFRPAFVSAATRMNISPAQQAVLTETLIRESGGDVNQVATSYASAARARRSISVNIAKEIREKWIPPDSATLHWDGKQVSTLTPSSAKEETSNPCWILFWHKAAWCCKIPYR